MRGYLDDLRRAAQRPGNGGIVTLPAQLVDAICDVLEDHMGEYTSSAGASRLELAFSLAPRGVEALTLPDLVAALGGPTRAAEVGGVSRQWLHECRERGALTDAAVAVRMLDAAARSDPARWHRGRLVDVMLAGGAS